MSLLLNSFLHRQRVHWFNFVAEEERWHPGISAGQSLRFEQDTPSAAATFWAPSLHFLLKGRMLWKSLSCLEIARVGISFEPWPRKFPVHLC